MTLAVVCTNHLSETPNQVTGIQDALSLAASTATVKVARGVALSACTSAFRGRRPVMVRVFLWPFAGAGLAVLVIGTNGDDGGRPERGPGGLRQRKLHRRCGAEHQGAHAGAQLISEVPGPLAAGSTQLVVSD